MLFYVHVYRKMAILAKESSDNFARIMTGSQTYFETGRVRYLRKEYG
jgi:hypothetical protein